MQDLDWNDLRVFLTIAETGQIGRAAQSMQLDATTLGRRLRRLERRLEATLFERTREGQTLTEAGESLLAKAEAMAALAGTITEATNPQLGLKGNLRLSVSEGFGSQFLAPHLPTFAARHPHLTIDLVANSGFLSPSKREADIAVMLSRPQAGPVICQKLSDYDLALYASEAYLSGRSSLRNPADLAQGHSLVSYVPDLLYAPELDYLSEFHPGLVAQLRSSSINAQHRLILEGAGVGVLPLFMAESSGPLVNVCPERSIRRSLWLVTHRDTQNLARVRAAKEWLKRCVKLERAQLLRDQQTGC